jgi:hypothetical protein
MLSRSGAGETLQPCRVGRRGMHENSTHAAIAEIAAAERIDESYVGRVLRLTLQAPDIVEALLDGKYVSRLQLSDLLHPLPVIRAEQWANLENALLIRTHFRADLTHVCDCQPVPPSCPPSDAKPSALACTASARESVGVARRTSDIALPMA